MSFRRPATLLVPTVALLLAALVGAPPAAHAQEGPAGPPRATMEQLQALQQEIQRLSAELGEIQEAAFEASPELQDQREEMLDRFDDKMLEFGVDAVARRAEIDSLGGVLGDSTASEQARTASQERVQTIRGNYEKAQQQVVQDPDMQAAMQELNAAVLEVMEEEEPRTPELIANLQQAEQRFQMLMQGAMRRQQGQGVVPDPNGQR